MTPEQSFRNFHLKHPEVYRELVTILWEWRKSNGGPWSIWGAYQVARWQRRIKGLPDAAEPYKLSNNHTGFYARLIAHRIPSLGKVLTCRPGKHVRGFDPSTVKDRTDK